MSQFVVYMQDLGRGDLGTSLTTGQRVLHELITRLPASLELTLCALFLAVGVALPLGVWAATHPGSWIDHASRVLTTAGVSLPTFFTGLTPRLCLLLSARLGASTTRSSRCLPVIARSGHWLLSRGQSPDA